MNIKAKTVFKWLFISGGLASIFIVLFLVVVIGIGIFTSEDSGGGNYGNTSQPTASLYDTSKEEKAGPIVTTGWNESWVDNFYINSADPPYVTGEYIDAFLSTYYPQSKLIGYGNEIKRYADYYGVATGAFLGQIALETTFGISSCGGEFNFGCIRWYEGANYPGVDTKYGAFQDYPTVETGIESYFHLARTNYIDTGQVRYKDYLDKYSPQNDPYGYNNHDDFKSLFWGTLKAFGYDTSDNVRKKNHALPTEIVDGRIEGTVSSTSMSSNNTSVGSIDLSNTRLTPLVLSWQSAIESEMQKQGVPTEYLPILLGILANESGGGGVNDIFQSSESRGWAMNTIQDEYQSIEIGVEHFKNTLNKTNQYGKSIWAAVAGYNFGHAFLDYLNRTDQDWSIEVAKEYSATVVVPSLGNTTREQAPYVNDVSMSYNIPYYYWNGGNFHYVPMLMWNLGYSLDEIREMALSGASGSMTATTTNYRILFGKFKNGTQSNLAGGDLVEIAKTQIGLPYSWGGGGKEGPTVGIYDPAVQDATNIVGFDCSGFMQWIYYTAYGVDIGDWTEPQKISGQRISSSDLQVGDLLFWGEPTTYHVAMYIGDNQLIESSTPGNPIGIHPMRGYDFIVHPDIEKLKSQQGVE